MSSIHSRKFAQDDLLSGKISSKTQAWAKTEEKQPILHDTTFNFVANSCFEIAVSMLFLDQPGIAGTILQKYADAVADMMEKVYDTALKDTNINIDHKAISIKTYFDQRILKELIPTSDQIGRSLQLTATDSWYSGSGKEWVLQQLRLKPTQAEYDFKNMLTKIRTISAFGGIIRQLSSQNKDIIEQLVVANRSQEIAEKIRHSGFDTSQSRARVEKTPLVTIEGKKISILTYLLPILNALNTDKTAEEKLTLTVFSGPDHAQVLWDANHLNKLIEQYELLINEQEKPMEQEKQLIINARNTVKAYVFEQNQRGRQSLSRQGQDMIDNSCPGLLSASSFALIPESFKQSDLLDELKKHAFEHGSGINRWQLQGSYAIESWNHDFPVAGAHSGGTVDFLLACNCLSTQSLLGEEELKPLGLLVSAFMNFGGYHSFIETYRIILAASKNEKFTVQVSSNDENLYAIMLDIAKKYSVGDTEKLNNYFNKLCAVFTTFPDLSKLKKELRHDLLLFPKLSAHKSNQSASEILEKKLVK